MRALKTIRQPKVRFFLFLSAVAMVFCLAGMALPVSAAALTGDLDGDGDVDRDDLTILLADRNRSVQDSTCGAACDLDGDGVITVLDARKLVLLCTLPRCAIVTHENQPPAADAGQDRVIVLEAGRKTVSVTLDGSASSDPDGAVTAYEWTGTPDPQDVATPVVTLKQGVYTFSLVVTDDQGAESTTAAVNITVIGPPLVMPLPEVTNDSTIPIKGVSVPGDTIVIRNNTTGEAKEFENPQGFFIQNLALAAGLNEIEIFARINGVESPHVFFRTTYTATTALLLESISPASGQIGTIVTLTGSGFTADPRAMGVYFKGTDVQGIGFESKAVVIEAAEDHLKAVVPFIFFNSEQDLQVWVYDRENISNAITFHVVPAQDPTPQTQGNEVDYQLDLILAQVQNVLDKLEEWTRPNVPEETWSALEENMSRLQEFVETLRDRIDAIPDENVKTYLDAVFGSEYFSLLDQKLEEANDILSHTTPCDINEVIELLNDALAPIRTINSILDSSIDWLYAALVGDSIACFFGCVPCCTFIPVIYQAISTIEAIDAVIDAILSVVDSVVDVLRAAIPTNPSQWKVAVSGPFAGISNHILYSDTTNELSVYANFTNAGFEQLLKDQVDLKIGIPDPFGIMWIVEAVTGVDVQGMIEDALGDLLLDLAIDLLDIDEIHITFADIRVSSTVANTEANSPLTIPAEGVNAETHTIEAGSTLGTTQLDIQAACGAFQYPHRTKCEQMVDDTCLQWGTDYPEYFPVEVIDVPVIENWEWVPVAAWGETGRPWDRYDLKVEGKGLSGVFERFKVYWNDDYLFTGANAGPNSFDVTGYLDGHKPGWLKVAVIDPDGNQRESTPVYIPPSPDLDVRLTLDNPSVFPGDTLYGLGNYFTSYPADHRLILSHDDSTQAQINPYRIWWKNSSTILDVLAFEIPDLRAFDDTSFLATLQVGHSPYITSDQEELKLLPFESAGRTAADDQDLMVFSASRNHVRSVAVGDLNGDGVNDLVVGAPSFGRDQGHPVGAVFIKFGPLDGNDLLYGDSVRKVVDIFNHYDVRIWGDINDMDSGGNSRRIGKSLAIGDVNGDGIQDLIIGTSDRNDSGEHRADINFGYTTQPAHIPGKAYVIYGRNEWQSDYTLEAGQYDVKFYGDDGRELGFQVGTGRIYGQNQEDLVITAPADALNDTTSRVYVIQGWQGTLAQKDIRLPGDLNDPYDPANDPANDLEIFSHHAIIEGKNYYQHDPLTGTTYLGSGMGKALGLGDINGDGLDDIVLGAPDYSQRWSYNPWNGLQGAVYVFYGRDQDQEPLDGVYKVDAKTNSTGDYTAVWGARSRAVNDVSRFGTAVAVADLNGDGSGELIVGAPAARLELRFQPAPLLRESYQSIVNIEEPDIGRIYIFNGDNPELNQPKTTADYDADVVVNGSMSISHFGYALASGDINGDGFSDLLVGAPGRNQGRGHLWVLYGTPTPFWRDTRGQDLVQLQRRRYVYNYSSHFRDLDPASYYFPMEEGMDYLFVGPDPKPVDLPGFGAFVAAGDLDPYLGDDVLVIDPAADAPEPDSSNDQRPYAGMLHVFYEGSLLPLTISPEAATMNDCGDQLTFTVQGGREPYQFSWLECYQSTLGILCQQGLAEGFEVQYNENQVNLTLGQCVDPNLVRLKLGVSDAAGNGAYSWIDIVAPPTFLDVSSTSMDLGPSDDEGLLSIGNSSTAETLSWSITDDLPPWLTADQMSGTVAPGDSVNVDLFVDRSGLDPGPYEHTITITSNGGDATVAVSMTVGEALATFAKYYGGDGGEYFAKVIATADGGFIAAGLTNSFGAGAEDVWVVKLDSSGYVQWEKTYGGADAERAYDIKETPDGGYIVAAGTMSYATWYGLWIFKLNAHGEIQWEKSYEGCADDNWGDWGVNFTLDLTSDGGYVVAGNTRDLPGNTCTESSVSGSPDVWVLKLDSQGGIQWQKTFGGTDDEYANAIRQTADGGYIVAGVAESFGQGETDAWIMKLDSSGAIQWQKTVGGSDDDYAYDVQPTGDGGYVAAGLNFSQGGAWLIKLDSSGDIQWEKTYGGYDGRAASIAPTDDGGFIIVGSFYRSGRGDDAWLIKLDASGNIQWQKTYGGQRIDVAYSVQQTEEGDYVVAGYTNSFRTTPYGSGNYDAWVFKVDSMGNIGTACDLVDWTGIEPVTAASTGAIPADITTSDSSVSPVDTSGTVQDSNAEMELLCRETIPQAAQRPLIDIEVSPLSHDFGEVVIGNTVSQVFTVKSLGYQPLSISSLSLSGSGEFEATDNCPSMLDSAQQCEITVFFTPTSAGEKEATLTIESNDPDESLINIPITGTGYASGEEGGGEEGPGGGVIIIPGG